jgi:3'-phosphoadenosine 5'-phosphosulfate sulfotransferase (PAPS reductase)/FAD synthetase
MIYTKLEGNLDVDDLIVEIFETEKDIDFLRARNSEACCFICKIERI